MDEEYSYVALPLLVTYASLSILGILFALVCLIFNLFFREQKYVIISMYTVNAMIYLG